jgi:hypothetical protein
VEQLELWLGDFPGSDGSSSELAALLSDALRCCAARLVTLQLSMTGCQAPSWDVSATVGALSHLRSLTIRSSAKLAVTSSLAALTALEELEVHSTHHPSIDIRVALPPTVTSLALGLCGDNAMLSSQVGSDLWR